eukprot:10928515-Karenia_brevis.AAC.1
MSNSIVGEMQSCTAKSSPPREEKRGGDGGGETPEGARIPSRSDGGKRVMGWESPPAFLFGS